MTAAGGFGFGMWRRVSDRAFGNGVFVARTNYAGPHGGTTYLSQGVIVAPDVAELSRPGDLPSCLTATLDRRRPRCDARGFLGSSSVASRVAVARRSAPCAGSRSRPAQGDRSCG